MFLGAFYFILFIYRRIDMSTIGETVVGRTTGNQAKINNTFAASGITLDIGAGETLEFYGNLNIDAASGGGGFKCRFANDGNTNITGDYSIKGNAGIKATAVNVTTGSGSTSFFNDTTPFPIQGSMTNNGTAGTVTLEFAQNATVAGIATNLQQNSMITATRTA